MAYTLKWDEVGEKRYELGVDRGVLYIQDGDGSYEDGIVWNGLTAVTESPSGAEASDLYADNIKYASLRSAETFGGTIEAYTYPDEFGVCDGTAELAKGVEIHQQPRQAFGFCYRTMEGNDTVSETDDGYKIHLVYNAMASPSERAYSTINDSPEAITLSWEFTTTPIPVTGHKPTALITIDARLLDKTKLAALEQKLYGDGSEAAALPTPDEVLNLVSDP